MSLSTHQEYHGWVGLSTQLSKRQQKGECVRTVLRLCVYLWRDTRVGLAEIAMATSGQQALHYERQSALLADCAK